VTVSSSSAPIVFSIDDADLVLGNQQYTNLQCEICHKYNGAGEFDRLGTSSFNLNDWLAGSSFTGLVQYIEDFMPLGGAAQCAGDCALNTAAVMVNKVQSGLFEPQAAACTEDNEISYGIRTIRLLTSTELSKSLVDIGLIASTDFAANFSYIGGSFGKSSYPVNTNNRVDESTLDKIMLIAENLSVIAADKLRQNTGCGTNCEQAFFTVAERLFRRPLTSDEQSTYRAIFTELGNEEGLQTALAAAMASPQFIYRSELGVSVAQAIQNGWNLGSLSNGGSKLNAADPNAYVLDPYELATALAYMYTGSTPDSDLMTAARNNQLTTEAQIDGQIARLVTTNRGREHTGNFGATWFLADRVNQAIRTDPKLTTEIKSDMAREVRELFNHVFYDSNIPFSDLYAGDFTVLNRRLAQYYGINNTPSNGDDDWRVTTTTERGGILTTGAFMVTTASDAYTRPIIRAVKMRELMLCHKVPPPNNIAGDPAEQQRLAEERQAALDALTGEIATGQLTSRQFFEKQTDNALCDACHEFIINPLFGMEDFDAFGLPRTTQSGVGENGVGGIPVDSNGILYGLTSAGNNLESLVFNGTKDLAEQIADLPAISSCLASNSFRWTTGLPIDTDAYSGQANGAIDEPVRLTADQESQFSCVKEQLVAELDSTNDPMSLYRKIGNLDLIRLRRSIDDSQRQN
jgi:hypothetical protein